MNADRRRELNMLVIRFADGDRSAFQPLFDGLWPDLLALARRALPHMADAEDAAQQAMLKVFSRIADFDRNGDGVSWAFGIVAFEVMTARKQRLRRREGNTIPDALVESAANQEEVLVRAELATALREALGSLSPLDQEALAPLLDDRAAPTDETHRKRRFRALTRLRDAWRRSHG